MKTPPLFVVMAVLVLLCSACRPEEEPVVSTRQTNLQKYVKKASELSHLQMQRDKPLPVEDLFPLASVSNTPAPIASLAPVFSSARKHLEKQLHRQYTSQTAAELNALLDRQLMQTKAAAAASASSGELAEKLLTLTAAQRKEMDDFIAHQAQLIRLTPSPEQSARESVRLRPQRDEFMAQIRLDYGDASAEAAAQAWDSAQKAYFEALQANVAEEQVNEQLEKLVKQADVHLHAQVQEKGDPLGVMPAPDLVVLRAERIAAEHKLESYIEPLYGKEAVLAVRKIFNQTWQDGQEVLLERARLSHKKRELGRLNEHYRRSLLALQKQWDAALAAEFDRPPAYLLSSI